MQFVADGPDVPASLLEAHEEGRVVLFCGAGISYPAALPGFKGLVDRIYRIVAATPSAIEKASYDRGQYDAALEQLERNLPGRRVRLLRALAEALQPKLRRKGAKDTHLALLQLARTRSGALRLVTTNIDRIFARLTAREVSAATAYVAPMLPIPKMSRWDGLVYLHGLLSDHIDETTPCRVVLTSGDFGLAYLTERWAARFVSELFRNYVVCFVGYSIDDPVLRYMMDALAADRLLGESTPEAYAFAACTPKTRDARTVEWKAKGVIPILYEVPPGDAHTALHRTLKVWAEMYRHGIPAMERIVVQYAGIRPAASTQQDDFVGRMRWALSHKSGLPAKLFAEFNPVPSLEWLQPLLEQCYGHGDLGRFGVPAHSAPDDKLRFSIARRPTPYQLSPWMQVVSDGSADAQWDDVMHHFSRWLVRHLDDPELVSWLSQRGGPLHPRLLRLIEMQLAVLAELENEGKRADLAAIRVHSPKGIPRPLLRIVWRLFLTGCMQTLRSSPNFYRWQQLLKTEGLTATLRFDLRKALAPKLALKRPFRRHAQGSEGNDAEKLSDLFDWELVLASDHVRASLRSLRDVPRWRSVLIELVRELENLLLDALDLLRELGEAVGFSDRSYWDLPSVEPHWQNRDLRDWVALIELVRDAWLAIRDTDPLRSNSIARTWFAIPYAAFKRLALFAASHTGSVAAHDWVEWLVDDEAWCLWAPDTRREVMRLLATQGMHLTSQDRLRLEDAILVGPAVNFAPEDPDTDQRRQVADHAVWLRLSKLESLNASLGQAAASRLSALSSSHPEWHLASDERDEFISWMSGTGDPGFEDSIEIDRAPRKRVDLANWLKRPPKDKWPLHHDTWSEMCRKEVFRCAVALCDLTRESQWPAERWKEAFVAWSEEESRARRSWRFLARLVETVPEGELVEVVGEMAVWLKAASKAVGQHEDIFIRLCRRALAAPHEGGSEMGDPLTAAINHPVGQLTEALIAVWFGRRPNDGEELPVDLEALFTQLCENRSAAFRHARVLLAANVIALLRVDRCWTNAHLLPFFDWDQDMVEARGAWGGFLWSPRLFLPLLIALKQQFLETARHYSELGRQAHQFATFLTYAALEQVDTYTQEDFRNALQALPPDGLESSVEALIHALDGADEHREGYWRNRVRPFWFGIWPQSIQRASKDIAEALARLSIAASGEFPDALSAIAGWLQPIEGSEFVILKLSEAGLSARFPEEALRLLDAVIDERAWAPDELVQCLDSISRAAPALSADPRHQRLRAFARRRS